MTSKVINFDTEARVEFSDIGNKMTALLLWYVDISWSMKDEIAQVYQALVKSLHEIRKINNENPDVVFKIHLYVFNEEAKPIVSRPLLPQDLLEILEPLSCSGCTYIGNVFKSLDANLSRKGMLTPEIGNILPTVVLISDMKDNDVEGKYEAERDRLQDNQWFKRANKIGIAVNGGNKKLISDFTQSEDLVLELSNNVDIMKKVSRILVTASLIGGQTHTTEEDKAEMLKSLIKSNKEMDIEEPIEGCTMPDLVIESLINAVQEPYSID